MAEVRTAGRRTPEDGDDDEEFHDAQDSSDQQPQRSGGAQETALRERYLIPHPALCKMVDGRYLVAVAVRTKPGTEGDEVGLAPRLQQPGSEDQLEWVSTSEKTGAGENETGLEQVYHQIFGQTFRCGARSVRVVEPAQSAAQRIRKVVLEKMDQSGKVVGKAFQQDVEVFLRECGMLRGAGAASQSPRGQSQAPAAGPAEEGTGEQPAAVEVGQYAAFSQALRHMKVGEMEAGRSSLPFETAAAMVGAALGCQVSRKPELLSAIVRLNKRIDLSDRRLQELKDE